MENPFPWKYWSQIESLNCTDQWCLSKPKWVGTFTYISRCWVPFHQNLSPSVKTISSLTSGRRTTKRSLLAHRFEEPSSDSCFGHMESDWASLPATKENISGGVCCKMLHDKYFTLLHSWITFFKEIDPASCAPPFSTLSSHKPRRKKLEMWGWANRTQ